MCPFFVCASYSFGVVNLRSIIKQLEDVCTPVVEGMGYVFWGLQYIPRSNSALLRVFIDADSGISVDDCAAVSHQLVGVLDVENSLQFSYSLEVSSPGLDRFLFKFSQYPFYRGSSFVFHFASPVSGLPKKTEAKLIGVDEALELLTIEREGKSHSLPFASIDKARLVPDIKFNR